MKNSFINAHQPKQNFLVKLKTSQQRKKFWLEQSGAMYEMCYNPLYYPRLLKEKEGFTSKYTKQIDKDLHRTFPDDQFFKSGEIQKPP